MTAPTIADARYAAAKAAAMATGCDVGAPCPACAAIADQVVAAFLQKLADGPPQYVACRHPDGRLTHAWIAPHDIAAIAATVKP